MDGAAAHLGVTTAWLRNQIRAGRGPTFYRPSKKSTFFVISDLDTWKKTWPRVEASK